LEAGLKRLSQLVSPLCGSVKFPTHPALNHPNPREPGHWLRHNLWRPALPKLQLDQFQSWHRLGRASLQAGVQDRTTL